MRNLTFLAAPAVGPAAASFRRAFMEKTASWSVTIEECSTRSEAAALLSAKKSHAFVVSAPFRRAVFEAGKVQGASARLARRGAASSSWMPPAASMSYIGLLP